MSPFCRGAAWLLAVGMLACGEAVSVTELEENTPPTITMLLPTGGVTEVDESLLIDFSGLAADLEDGDISAGITWSSSVDGPLGTGPSITAHLSVGSHIVEAVVRDDDGAEAMATRPIAVLAVAWSAVSSGANHSCGITDDMRAFCWGQNVAGQLGNGDSGSELQVEPVAPLGEHAWVQLAGGSSFTCGLTPTSVAFCWGANLFGNLGDSTRNERSRPDTLAGSARYLAVSAGVHHACALDLAGRALCWGNNSDGRLAVGPSQNVVLTPTPVTGDLRFVRLSVGSDHACGISSTSPTAYCWGRDNHGQLGDGAAPVTFDPVMVSGGHAFIDVEAGWSHTCGLTEGGTVLCWGVNHLSQLGTGSTDASDVPVAIASAETFVAITAGRDSACALATSGRAYCWGHNQLGGLGTGDRSGRSVPTEVQGGKLFRQLSADGFRTCGVTTEDEIMCWGGNPGLAAAAAVSVPTRVSFR